MRRFLFGLMVSVMTAAVLLAPGVSAEGFSDGSRTAPQSPSRHHAVVDPIRSHAVDPAVLVTIRSLRAKWQHVANCEVGGNWSMTGQSYSGIGFSNATWYQYGGTQYAPLAGLASEDQQILIGMRVTHGWVPDQNGCSPTGW